MSPASVAFRPKRRGLRSLQRFAGERINQTEGRAAWNSDRDVEDEHSREQHISAQPEVLHPALRAPRSASIPLDGQNVVPEVRALNDIDSMLT